MKKNILLIAGFLFFSQCLFAQQETAQTNASVLPKFPRISAYSYKGLLYDTTRDKDFYLQKSKDQRSAAWVMLGGGIVLSVVGVIGASATLFDQGNSADTYGVLALVGVGLGLGSIPVFISSGHNYRKAATLSFRNQHIYIPRQNSYVFKSQPALSVVIPL